MRRFERITERLKEISPVRLIVSSFFIIILIGALLLQLPISSRTSELPSVVDSLFIATSCTCVTGLTMFDTWTQWSAFGQIVMITLIQIGGLGLITFTTGVTLFLRRKLGLRDLQIAKEYTNGNVIDTPHLIRTILFVSFACEAVGALLLAVRFIPLYGVYGIWVSIFTAISSYCNAGFDIMGFQSPGMSLVDFAGDPIVSLTVSLLIVIGGIGFVVIVDIYSYGLKRFKKQEIHPRLTVHSVVVLKISATLLAVGSVLFFLLERENTLKGMNFFEQLNASFFQSVAARTAGFFTIPVGEEYDITKILTIILMFIGASPSSTGGGIKTTTFVVLLATVSSVLKGDQDTLVRKHRIEKTTVYKALSIAILSLLIIAITTSVMETAEAHKAFSAIDIIFEAASAFGTVGLTAGITTSLSAISKIALIITMFIGRVGPISLVFALTMRHARRTETILPEAKIIVG